MTLQGATGKQNDSAMKRVWMVADNIVSPLGMTSEENFSNVVLGRSGIRILESEGSPATASLIDGLSETPRFTRFENLVAESIAGLIQATSFDVASTLLILSTTKGNVELLARNKRYERISLHASAGYVASQFGLAEAWVVSNACISGVLALGVAQRALASRRYRHALVVGADVISPFIIAGFRCLHALSGVPCRPFDRDREGISLGEGAGAMLLTTQPEAFEKPAIMISGVGVSNDANHISGPSRTGEELATAIDRAMRYRGLKSDDIDFISAHGTATIYNDEMEARAFTVAKLQHTPLNSLKGYYGHTLGAAGVIETIITRHALLADLMVGTKGFEQQGGSVAVNVVKDTAMKHQKVVLKTASGFGGCNAALVMEKLDQED